MATDRLSNDGTSLPKAASVLAKQPDADPKKELSVAEARPDREYVTGVKLFVIVATVTFASFLMLLDNMIVSMVGCTPRCRSWRRLIV